MKKILSAMLGLALSLAWSGASARVTDQRTVQSEPVPAKMIQTAETQKSLRRAKPRLAGDFRIPNRRSIPRKASSANPTIYASIFDYAPEGVGIYSMTPAAYEFSPVKIDDNISSKYGGAYANGVFYNINASGQGYSWNVSDWTILSGPIDTELECTAMAVDPQTGVMYACAETDNSYDIITVNPADFSRTSTLRSYNIYTWFPGLFFGLDNNLYGINNNGELFRIDKTSGETTLIIKTGIDCSYGAGVAVDPESGICYLAADDFPCALYELDLQTGESSLIYEFDEEEEINCIFILPKATNSQVPAAAESLTASFAEGSLTGSLNWTAPLTTAAGAAGSGTLSYSLKCNDQVIASGTTEWGAKQSANHTVDKAGTYAFTLTFSTDEGESNPTSATLWIGHDSPKAVTDATVTRSGSENTISWKASAGGSHGGYVDPALVTYKVTRRPDGEVIAASTSETTIVDQLTDGNSPILYSYDITPVYQGIEGETTHTGQVMVGAVYYNPFDSKEQFNEWESTTMQSNPIYDIPVWEYSSTQKAASVGYCEVVAVAAWLTSPALTLESGKSYKLSFETWCSNSSYDEQLSVYISTGKKAADIMKETPLIDKMIVNNENSAKKTVEVLFTPEVSGTYYLAFNGCSQPDLGTLFLDNVLFYSVPVLPVPEAPTISCSAFGGMLMVTATAPAHDVEGNELTALTQLIIKRDSEVIRTYTDPEPGETYNFFDFLPGDGTFIYSAIAYSEAGASAAGTTVVSTLEAGKPRSATNLQTVEDGNSGIVTLSWDAPATDVNNLPIEEGTLTFDVYAEGASEPLFTDLTETSKTWQAVESGKQEFLSFYVIAKNEAGSSTRSDASMPAAFGTPASMPFTESFAGMELSNIWSFYNPDDYSEGQWLLIASSETPKADPVDGDGGMLAFTAEYLEDSAWATSGKIDLTGSQDPKLTFYYFAQNKREGKDQLDVYVSDGTGYKRLDSFTMRDLEVDGWQKREIDLAAYADKTISLRFVGVSFRTGNFMLIDKIEISSAKDDLAVTLFEVPASVVLGKSFSVQTVITNNSSKPTGSYSVVLYRNGVKAEVESGSALDGGKQAAYIFDQTPDATWPETATYKVEIQYAADMVPENNTSDEAEIEIIHNNYPGVATIGATYTDESQTAVEVTWSAPDRKALPVEEWTERFEFLNPFDVNPECDWTFIDGDGSQTYGSQMYPYPNMGSPMAYIVYNAEHFNATYLAHSGSQYLASLNAIDKPTDDWMISPELSGQAQTISFHARSYSDTYGLETFEILSSATGTAVGDFTLVARHENVPVDWTAYQAELPEGTKHFAIRCTSSNVFAFFVDDVCFTPAVNPASKFGILGYNVYRDGVRMNDKPLNALSFSDYALPAATPRYSVSVVYDHGESPLSAEVEPGWSEISEISVSETGGETYDLLGRRVTAPGRGIYIRNGHKVQLK